MLYNVHVIPILDKHTCDKTKGPLHLLPDGAGVHRKMAA